MIRQILDFAKHGQSTEQPTQVKPEEVLRRVTSLMKSALPRDYPLVSSIPPHLPAFTTSRYKLESILANLIVNARDAMPSGGSIHIGANEFAGMICFSVSDTGIGMTPEQLEKAGTMFFSTKGERGTGLGLATARAFAEENGGRLEIMSAAGIGTTVTVQLPLVSGTDDKVVPMRQQTC